MRLIFDRQFHSDLLWWARTDRVKFLKVLESIESISADPFNGIGKPEPLRYAREGTWSRRITQEHRLVYAVRGEHIEFLQARYHYEK